METLPRFEEVSPALRATLLVWGTAQAVWPDGQRCWAERRGERVVIFLLRADAGRTESCCFLVGNWLRAGLWPETEEPVAPRWWRGWDPGKPTRPAPFWRHFAVLPQLWEVSRPLQDLLRRERMALGETSDGLEYRAHLWQGKVEFTGPDPLLPEPEPYYPDRGPRPIIREEPAGVVWRSWWRN
jgi:hypothetical protein